MIGAAAFAAHSSAGAVSADGEDGSNAAAGGRYPLAEFEASLQEDPEVHTKLSRDDLASLLRQICSVVENIRREMRQLTDVNNLVDATDDDRKCADSNLDKLGSDHNYYCTMLRILQVHGTRLLEQEQSGEGALGRELNSLAVSRVE
jgi:hypothetical protein